MPRKKGSKTTKSSTNINKKKKKTTTKSTKKTTKKVVKKELENEIIADDFLEEDLDNETHILDEDVSPEEEKSRIKVFLFELRNNPKLAFKRLFRFFKRILYSNKLLLLFVFLVTVNGFFLRLFTANENNNAFNLDALLADFSFALIVGSFSLFIKKRKYGYLRALLIFLSILCVINSAYYTYYTSFTSITLLSIVKYTTSIGDAIFKNVLQIKDFIYLIAPIVFIVVKRRYVKTGYLEKINYYRRHKKQGMGFLALGIISLVLFFTTCTATDFGRLDKQWNREYIVMKYGIYIYHVNDLIKSVEPKVVAIFGYDNAIKNFNEYYNNKESYDDKNEYTNILEGKNVIVIHGESVQNFVIGLKFNGQEVTPNLNRLAAKSLYFDNFYTQVSVGTSSDTEFTFNTSLMPAMYGTAFSNYFDKEYFSTPILLKQKGYYTFAMHGNNGDFWNRRIMHANLGYDKLYAKSDYDIDEVIGLGISDVSFFRQSVEKLKKIDEEHDKYFGYVITLTNHTPFSDLDKYGEFDVDIKERVYNSETRSYEDVVYPYMEGTKLGRYLKSVHYADYALGLFLDELKKEGLLENTAFIFYGDHDARLPKEDFIRLYNYDKTTDGILPETDPNYVAFDEYEYELNRKTPLTIWSKEIEKKPKKISYYMGMYDLQPTLGNMLGFSNKYALGHDIFNIKEKNIIVFPSGNWLTKDMYYNTQKGEAYTLSNSIISEDYISENSKYAENLLKVSNDILIYDLIRNSNIQTSEINENEIVEGANP